MISVLGSTGKYILQPSLLEMHKQTLEWLSATALWKREISFFQKVLDQHANKSTAVEFKKDLDHYQNLITYYNGELVDELRKKLRGHESKLAHMLQSLNEADTEYFKEHKGIMDELTSFQDVFYTFKHGFFDFIEHGYSAY
jgi:hypothetical protein